MRRLVPVTDLSLVRCPVRAEVRRFEGLIGVEAVTVSNKRAKQLLLSRQWWDLQHEDTKLPSPVAVLKRDGSASLYLYKDSPAVASRRARLRFDRSGLNESRFRRKLSPTPHCPSCPNVADSADHVLLACPQYAAARQSCQTALGRFGLSLNSPLAMGFVDDLQPITLQADVLAATSPLLDAICRISARRS